MSVTLLTNSKYSDKPNQVWIFKAMPIAHPKPIFTGLIKALIVKYLFTIWLTLFLFALWFWGVKIIDDFLFGGIFIITCSLLIFRFNFDSLPLSKSWNEMEKGSNVTLMFTMMFGLGIVGGMHYYFVEKPLILGGIGLFLIVVSLFVWHSFNRWTWAKLEMS